MSLKAWGGTLRPAATSPRVRQLRSLPGSRSRRRWLPAPPPPGLRWGLALGSAARPLTVAWTTLEAQRGAGLVRHSEPTASQTEEGPASTDHRVVLPSLPPGNAVRYRVDGGARRPGGSPARRSKAAKAPPGAGLWRQPNEQRRSRPRSPARGGRNTRSSRCIPATWWSAAREEAPLAGSGSGGA